MEFYYLLNFALRFKQNTLLIKRNPKKINAWNHFQKHISRVFFSTENQIDPVIYCWQCPTPFWYTSNLFAVPCSTWCLSSQNTVHWRRNRSSPVENLPLQLSERHAENSKSRNENEALQIKLITEKMNGFHRHLHWEQRFSRPRGIICWGLMAVVALWRLGLASRCWGSHCTNLID